MAAKMASLDQYTFDLRSGLRDAARVGLGQLEEMINELGYGWLDSHMEGILERTSQDSFTELMKTPSRTQTVKKTRAVTTALKERTDKVNRLNALQGSPTSKMSPSRAPLSPLQPRSVNASNVVLSPSPLKASSKSNLRPHSARGTPQKAVSSTLGRLGTTGNNILAVPSPSRAGQGQRKDAVMLSPAPKKQIVKSLRSPRHVQLASTSSTSPSSSSKQPAGFASLSAVSADITTVSEATMKSAKEQVTVPQSGRAEASTDTVAVDTAMNRTPAIVPTIVSDPPQPASQTLTKPGSPVSAPAGLPPVVTSSQPTIVPASQSAGAAKPIRQVRSSWLSKALGTTVVAGPTNSDLAGLRKSYAASSHKINGPIDLTNIRKSLAPPGVLAPANQPTGSKRPSDTTDEAERPEKISRVDKSSVNVEQDTVSFPTVSGTKSALPVSSAASHTPGPVAVIQPTSASSNEDTRPSQPMTQMRERQRSDIHKVTRALDELRERNAAKEAQKSKAALAASGTGAGPRQTSSSAHDRQSTAGSGFLRNLGNLSAGLGRSLGLGGTVKSAEEEAQRLAEELEEDRKAEAEAQQQLAKLMAEVQSDSELTVDGETKPGNIPEQQAEVIHDPPASAVDSGEARTEKDDEDMVASALDVATRPSSPVRPPTPPQVTVSIDANPRRTPQKAATSDVFESTTPLFSPVRPARNRVETIADHREPEKPLKIESLVKTKQTETAVQVDQIKRKFEAQKVVTINSTWAGKQRVADPDQSMEEDAHLPDLPEPTEAGDEKSDSDGEVEILEPESQDLPARKMFKSGSSEAPSGLPTSSSNGSLASSTLGQSTSSNINRASMIGSKMLGFKPVVGNVKSISQANAAMKKMDADRRNLLREQNEAKRAEIARKKLEEERQAAENERKAKVAEQERIRKNRAALEKSRKEREEKLAAAAREKAAKEEAERIAAKAKADEEARKRKAAHAAALAKSASNSSKAGPAVVPAATKSKEPIRAVKPGSTVGTSDASKLGPSTFRAAEVTLVPPRGTLGPPSRPSQLATQSQNPFMPYPAHLAHGSNGTRQPSTVLQQSRTQLQAQLDEKAAEIQSEDIVLPDIASEYSDSDDSDKETEFQRPQWAESPDLRAALEAQASRNPDEIFGPIKPLNMEELFKIRTNKFRARTSSANWNGGDRLTRAEEIEYARRMGFKPIGTSTQGQQSQQ